MKRYTAYNVLGGIILDLSRPMTVRLVYPTGQKGQHAAAGRVAQPCTFSSSKVVGLTHRTEETNRSICFGPIAHHPLLKS